MTIQIASALDGNPPVDAEQIKLFRRRASNADLRAQDLLMMSSSLIVQYMLSRLQGQFTAVDISGAVAAKLIPGTEAASVAAQIIQSILLTIIVDVANERLVELAQKEDRGGTTKYSRTKTLSQNDDGTPKLNYNPDDLDYMDKLAIRRVGEADYDMILEYVLGFIATNPHPKYGIWMSYMDLKQVRNEAIEEYRFGPQYSSKEMRLLNNIPPAIPIFQKEEVVAVTRNHLHLMEGQLFRLDFKSRMTTQVWDQSISFDMICCLTKYLSRKNKNVLKSLKALALMGQNFSNSELCAQLTFFGYEATIFSGRQLANGIIAIIEEVIFYVAEEVLKLVGADEEDLDFLFMHCPLTEVLLDLALKVIEYIQDFLDALMEETQGKDQASTDNAQNRYANTYQKRTTKTLIDLIDRLLEALDSDECSADEHGFLRQGDLVRITDSFNLDQDQYTVKLPPNIVEEHFPNSEPYVIPETKLRPELVVPALGQEAAIAGDEQAILKDVLERCGRRLTDADLDRISRATNGDT
jgi:hypothetical protein